MKPKSYVKVAAAVALASAMALAAKFMTTAPQPLQQITSYDATLNAMMGDPIIREYVRQRNANAAIRSGHHNVTMTRTGKMEFVASDPAYPASFIKYRREGGDGKGETFGREVEAAYKLALHPDKEHVIDIYEVTDDRIIYQKLNMDRVNEVSNEELAGGLKAALLALYNRDVVYLDIKEGNIGFDVDTQTFKMIDFDLTVSRHTTPEEAAESGVFMASTWRNTCTKADPTDPAYSASLCAESGGIFAYTKMAFNFYFARRGSPHIKWETTS